MVGPNGVCAYLVYHIIKLDAQLCVVGVPKALVIYHMWLAMLLCGLG